MKKAIYTGLALVLLAGTASAGQDFYDVTITNVTRGQSFTPIAVVTHKEQISLFSPGAPAINEIATMAESGNLAPLVELAGSLPDLVGPIGASEGLLAPGATTTIRVARDKDFDKISLVAMMIPKVAWLKPCVSSINRAFGRISPPSQAKRERPIPAISQIID